MVTIAVDMKEHRDVETVDMHGACFYVKMTKNKIVVLKLVGVFVDIMCRVNPIYEDYVIYEKLCTKNYSEPSMVVWSHISRGTICTSKR